MSILVYDSLENSLGLATTNAAGFYSVPLGTSAVTVFARVVNHFDGIVKEVYSDIPCPLETCFLLGTEIAVPAVGTVAGIDFDLSADGRIEGTITETLGAGVSLIAFDAKGRAASVAFSSDATNGAYSLRGLPPGSYYVRTSSGSHASLQYPDVPCPNNSCDVFQGSPVAVGPAATTSGIDFTLEPGGAIAGAISDGSGAVINGFVEVYRNGRLVGSGHTFGGNYQINGLGTGFYRVVAHAAPLVSEVYPNTPCPSSGCDLSASGSGVSVTAGLLTTGINIQLAPGFFISGFLSRSGAGFPTGLVQVFNAATSRLAGLTLANAPNGFYSVRGLPGGGATYKVRAFGSGAVAELYDNIPCPGPCAVAAGATVTINSSGLENVNFDLDEGSTLIGTVLDQATGDPVPGLRVQAAPDSGSSAPYSIGTTNRSGDYVLNSEGLPAGSYQVRTVGPEHAASYLDEAWRDAPCEPDCENSAGDPIVLVTPLFGASVDFALTRAGMRFFTLPPCRVFDSRLTGPPIASAAVVPLRIEAKCGVPGHAAAVSANVTVVSPQGRGSLSIWPANLATPPNTQIVSFSSGIDRATNAMLAMSLRGLDNVMLRGTVAGGGSYHAVIDVNGYFAPSVAP